MAEQDSQSGRIDDATGKIVVPDGIFFFQAEDGIRDLTVTGVQTCALPISGNGGSYDARGVEHRGVEGDGVDEVAASDHFLEEGLARGDVEGVDDSEECGEDKEIGRASCRGRG